MNVDRLKELQQFKGKSNSQWPCTGDELNEIATALFILINDMNNAGVIDKGDSHE